MTNKYYQHQQKETKENNDIAVIGMSGRFPGASNIDEFWENLIAGKDMLHHFTEEELLDAGIAIEALRDPNYIKVRGVLSDIDKFDADFFGMNAYEATITDPQQRLFLESCYHALESSGHPQENNDVKIGVFGGCSDNTYLYTNLQKNRDFLVNQNHYQTHIASSHHFLTTKVAYYLNLTGPSITISTACSTSLVAVITACQALLNGHCDLALAGGVSIKLPQERGYFYQEGGVLSKDGACRPFDAKASGTVSSAGVGVIVLKRLQDAVRDHDPIDAVIKGYHSNNDGAHKMNYASPSIQQQYRCIKEAAQGIDLSTIAYVEMHGTGTLLGDPIEMAGLVQAYQQSTIKPQSCAIGSVKSNIGHADVTAGIIGLIKTVLVLKHRTIPPTVHYNQLNTHITLDKTPFYVCDKLLPWKSSKYAKRRAAVSSFGIGGTNAHIILEETPPINYEKSQQSTHIIALSAKSTSALKELKRSWSTYLNNKNNQDISLADVAYTLFTGRRSFNYRQAWVCSNVREFKQLLNDNNDSKIQGSLNEYSPTKLVFLFPGQGTLAPGTFAPLYHVNIKFKEILDDTISYVPNEIRQDVLNFIMRSNKTHTPFSGAILQVAHIVIEYTLAKTLMMWGISPDAMLGHSLGEYVAACLANVLPLETVLSLVMIRGQLSDTLPLGSMLAIPLSIENVEAWLDNKTLSIAAVNASQQCVIAGKSSEIERARVAFDKKLKAKTLKCTLVNTRYAFHSHMIEDIIPAYQQMLQQLTYQHPEIPYISNVTGQWITKTDFADKTYFAQHMRKPVLFQQGLEKLIQEGHHAFIEVGSGAVLSALLKQSQQAKHIKPIVTLPKVAEKKYVEQCLHHVAATCWVRGVTISAEKYYAHEARHKLHLPTYPFKRQSFWIKPDPQKPTGNTLLGSYLYLPTWRVKLIDPVKQPNIKENWLVFTDELANVSSLIALINDCNDEITVVTQGDTFSQLNPSHYQINPISVSDHQRLLETLNQHHNLPSRIIYYGCVLGKDGKNKVDLDMTTTMLTSLYSVLYCVQACMQQKHYPTAIDILTNHLNQIGNYDSVIPEHSMLTGLALVIMQESRMKCKVIDVDNVDLFVQNHMLTELLSDTTDRIISYRGGCRLVRNYQQQTADVTKTTCLKKNGVYVITGGLGQLGLAVAEYLASKHTANIILISRRQIKWNTQRDQHGNDGLQDLTIINRLNRINKQANTLRICSADVADYNAMHKLFENIQRKHQHINGVFHFAGVLEKRFIKDIDQTFLSRQLKAKVYGLNVLDTLFKTIPVEFCILSSSLSTILGGVGLAIYAAVNCYMNAYAQMKEHSHVNWISINCDALMTEKSNYYNTKLNTLTGEDVVQWVEKILSQNNIITNCFLTKSTDGLNDRIEKTFTSCLKSEFNQDTTSNISTIQHDKPISQSAITNILRSVFKECLKVKTIGKDDDFFSLGGDSLDAVRLIAMIEEKLQIELTLADLIDHISVNTLAEFIYKRQSKQVKSSFLYPLSMSKSGRTIFFIHPIGGSSFSYHTLATLLADQFTCYGIDDPVLHNQNITFSSLRSMAATYLKMIKQEQPSGPYILAGHSFGANVAYEIATQLQDNNDRVLAVILIDGWARFSTELKDYKRFIEAKDKIKENIMNMDILDDKKKQLMLTLQWDRMNLLFNSHLKTTNFDLILFKARKVLPEYKKIDDSYNHWRPYTSGNITVYSIDDDHNTILNKSHAEEMARHLKLLVHSGTEIAKENMP